jgi:hypothetical protein
MASTSYQEIEDSLRQLYVDNPRPWLVGFSGGKDSRTSRKSEIRTAKGEPEKRDSAFCILNSALRVGTPSCGNSHFGFWACTVVERDNVSEGLLADGDERTYSRASAEMSRSRCRTTYIIDDGLLRGGAQFDELGVVGHTRSTEVEFG